MKIELANIGKIESASIEVNGITVIAGENNTGKSTVGKALFSVFNAFHNVDTKIQEERVLSVESLLNRMFVSDSRLGLSIVHSHDIAVALISEIQPSIDDPKVNIFQTIMDLFAQYGIVVDFSNIDEFVANTVEKIKEVLRISDQDFLKIMLGRKLNSEFNGQVCNIFSDQDSGFVSLCIGGKKINIAITSNGSLSIDNQQNVSLGTEVIYIDDPFLLDEINNSSLLRRSGFLVAHREHLLKKISKSAKEVSVFDEIIASDKLNEVYEKISSVYVGDIVSNSKLSQAGYKVPSSDKILRVSNLSTGLKTFAILKRLLKGGVIQDNGTIILDEPEIHLHPEWQILLAELIVLLHKHLNLHVLLNTHSPYFLRAIEVYSAKNNLANVCKYYLSEDCGSWSKMIDVSDNVNQIYKMLHKPFQALENEMCRND